MHPDAAVLFFPQLLLALRPKRLFAGSSRPCALLVDGRIEARNAAANALGIRRSMTADKALEVLPQLELERAGSSAAAELSLLMLLIARGYSEEAALIRSPGSGAAALLLKCGAKEADEASLRFSSLGMENFPATGASPKEALEKAVAAAKDAHAAFDAEALERHARTFAPQQLLRPGPKEAFSFRATLDPDEKPLQTERIAAALHSWCAAGEFTRLTLEIDVRDETGRPVRRFCDCSRTFTLDGCDPLEEEFKIRRLLLEAAASTIAGSLSIEAHGEKGVRSASPLVRKLEERFGATRVYQLERTGNILPESLQRRVPAESLLPRAHQRPPVAATELELPAEIFPQPREVPLDRTMQPVLEGPLHLKTQGSAANGRTYYAAESVRGELLWIYREDSSGRWFLQGRFA